MSGAEIAIPIISALGPTVLWIISEALGITATHGTSTCGSVIQLGVSGYRYVKHKIKAQTHTEPEPENIPLETIHRRADPTGFALSNLQR